MLVNPPLGGGLIKAGLDQAATVFNRNVVTMQKAVFSKNALMATPPAAMEVAMNWMLLPYELMSQLCAGEREVNQPGLSEQPR